MRHDNDTEYRRLINSSRWQTLRNWYVTNHPLCEECKAQGFVTPAKEVHHVKPVTSGYTAKEKETLCFDINNLQALCVKCHVAAHMALGKQTTQYYKEAAKRKLDNFESKFL